MGKVMISSSASAVSTQLGTQYLLTAEDDVADDAEGEEAEEEEEGDALEFADSPFGKKKKTTAGSLPSKAKLVEQIVTNNIFCPTCKPVEEVPAEAYAGGPEGIPPGARAMVAKGDPGSRGSLESTYGMDFDKSWDRATKRRYITGCKACIKKGIKINSDEYWVFMSKRGFNKKEGAKK